MADDEPDTYARAKEAFLIAYRATANVSEGARAAHVHRATPYDWRAKDPEFAAAWDEAKEVAIDTLEAEARRRAMDSSDRLMELLLKANRPEKYQDVSRIEMVIGKKTDAELIEHARRIALSLRPGDPAGAGEAGPDRAERFAELDALPE